MLNKKFIKTLAASTIAAATLAASVAAGSVALADGPTASVAFNKMTVQQVTDSFKGKNYKDAKALYDKYAEEANGEKMTSPTGKMSDATAKNLTTAHDILLKLAETEAKKVPAEPSKEQKEHDAKIKEIDKKGEEKFVAAEREAMAKKAEQLGHADLAKEIRSHTGALDADFKKLAQVEAENAAKGNIYNTTPTPTPDPQHTIPTVNNHLNFNIDVNTVLNNAGKFKPADMTAADFDKLAKTENRNVAVALLADEADAEGFHFVAGLIRKSTTNDVKALYNLLAEARAAKKRQTVTPPHENPMVTPKFNIHDAIANADLDTVLNNIKKFKPVDVHGLLETPKDEHHIIDVLRKLNADDVEKNLGKLKPTDLSKGDFKNLADVEKTRILNDLKKLQTTPNKTNDKKDNKQNTPTVNKNTPKGILAHTGAVATVMAFVAASIGALGVYLKQTSTRRK